MSRESLLDDAILKAKEAEDWQLVEWLRMARGGESAARWYTAKLNEARLDMSKLMTENAKLRMFIDLKETCWKYVGWCDECPYNGADDEHDDFNCTVQEKINLLARELGVEVDE